MASYILASVSTVANSSIPEVTSLYAGRLQQTFNSTTQSTVYDSFKFYINVIIIPLLLTFGAVGNALSLVLLAWGPSRRRLRPVLAHGPAQQELLPSSFRQVSSRRRVSVQPIERAAVIGLGALAVSDLAFCVVGIPAGLVELTGLKTSQDGAFVWIAHLYSVYRPPLHNLFLFSSTWITVSVAIERFIAVVNPLRARWSLKASQSVVVALLIFLVAGLVSGPLFFRNRFVTVRNNCSGVFQNSCDVITAVTEPRSLFVSSTFRTVYHVLWALLGTFIPLVVLCVSSTGLVVVLYRTRARGVASPTRYPCLRVTGTVTAVVLTYIVLVCPSMILHVVGSLSSTTPPDGVINSPMQLRNGTAYLTVMVVTNLTQAVWFSGNFLLYFGCSIGRHFRFQRQATGPTTWRLTAMRHAETLGSSIKHGGVVTNQQQLQLQQLGEQRLPYTIS